MCAPGGDLMTTVKLPGGSCRKSIPCDTAYVRSYGSGIAHPYRERLVRRECNGGALQTDHAGQWPFAAGHLKAAGSDTSRIAIKCTCLLTFTRAEVDQSRGLRSMRPASGVRPVRKFFVLLSLLLLMELVFLGCRV